MTIYEIIENNNIQADRYAMAAISCIFKAFGDSTRSKEFWPWGDKVQCPWTITKGTNKDITDAELLLERARLKYIEENNNSEKINYFDNDMNNISNNDIKSLQSQMNKIRLNIKKIDNISENTIDTSKDTKEIINTLTK